MRRLLRCSALLLLSSLVVPAFADDAKKPDATKPEEKKSDADKKPAEKKPADVVEVGRFSGQLMHVDESKNKIKLRLDVPELNQGEYQGLLNDQNQLQQVSLTERNPQTRLRRIMELQQSMARHQSNLYKKGHKDIELDVAEAVKVRWLMPPPKFDEKGRIARHTPEELKELKGDDPKVPGYTAEFSDLRDQQTIQVLVMRKKGAPKPTQPATGKTTTPKTDVDKAMALEAMTTAAAEFAPYISMIVIAADPPK